MRKLVKHEVISGDNVIAIISKTLHDIDDGDDLAQLFNDICQPKVKYIGDNLFEVVEEEEV